MTLLVLMVVVSGGVYGVFEVQLYKGLVLWALLNRC